MAAKSGQQRSAMKQPALQKLFFLAQKKHRPVGAVAA
jgi:hypothetical protein